DGRVIERNFGLQVVRLDEGVVNLDFFILITKLFLKFVGADTDPIRDQASELLFEQALADHLLKHRNGHLETLLDLTAVLVHANRAVAIERGGEVLFYTVRDFLVGDIDAEALRFKFDFLAENQLIQDLPRVKAFQGLRYLIAALDFRKLLANIG